MFDRKSKFRKCIIFIPALLIASSSNSGCFVFQLLPLAITAPKVDENAPPFVSRKRSSSNFLIPSKFSYSLKERCV